MKRLLGVVASVLFSLAAPAVVLADEDRAKAAYAMGDKAFSEGRYKDAAEAFALADEASPHAVALTSALKAAILADDPVLGMTLVDRAPARKATADLMAQADRARKQFQSRAGLVSVVCQCEPTLNDRPIKANTRVWAAAGPGMVKAGARSFAIVVSPSTPLDFVVPAEAAVATPTPSPIVEPVPPPPLAPVVPAPRAPDDDGLTPAIFGVMTGVTVASGACLVGFGARALVLNEDYLEGGDDDAKAPGQRFQTLANVFIALTAASAVTSAILIPFTDFGGGRAAVGPGSVAFALDLP